MAGHSKFKNIMHRKGAQDKKRAKIFNRCGREITVAVKEGGGGDPSMNPRLRLAIQNARAENMPKDKIDAAIKKGEGNTDTDTLEEIRYEGYGPAGVAILVEVMTDNRNRSAAEIRTAFSKNGGNLGETGSVGFMFDRVGVFTYPLEAGSEETLLELAIEAGADNCDTTDDQHEITCAMEAFSAVRDALMASAVGEPSSGKLEWRPQTLSPVDEEAASTLMKLIEVLEDNDDVQEVTTNADIADAVMEKLSAA